MRQITRMAPRMALFAGVLCSCIGRGLAETYYEQTFVSGRFLCQKPLAINLAAVLVPLLSQTAGATSSTTTAETSNDILVAGTASSAAIVLSTPILVAIVVSAVLGSILICLCVCNCYGNCIRDRGQRSLDDPKTMELLRKDGADPKFVKTATTPERNVEYFVYGEANPDPALPVLINLHGSGSEGSSEKRIYHAVAKHFGVKGIAISWVGHGGTDIKIGRKVCEWPEEDLDAVLRAESVGEFFITGHSSGNPHAMVAAWHFGARCVGMGLNCPCMDDKLINLVNAGQNPRVVTPAIGQEYVPKSTTASKCYMGWYWCLCDLIIVGCAKLASDSAIQNMDAPEDQWYKETHLRSSHRAAARYGVGPAGWETCSDTCFEWGFDLREIPAKGCKNICVWHAGDDTLCAADNGKWLAQYYAQQDGVTCDFRDDDIGMGHFTYNRGEFVTNPEKSMLKTMLDMWRGTYVPSSEANPIRKGGVNGSIEIRVQPQQSDAMNR